MKAEKALKKLKRSNNPYEQVLYQICLDIEKLKTDVKWLKKLTIIILASLLALLAKAFIL